MIDVATLSVIRRWALREHLSLREIARRTGLSRNTIKKYLRADTVEPRYAKRVSPSKLDPFADKLAGWLKTEAGKSRKQRRTVKQMHADLAALGYDGSYNRVAAFARVWQAKRQEAERTTGRGTFVPLTFGAGEAFQCDWSEDWAVIGGERTKLQVAHTKLSPSRAFIVRAYLLQTHEMRKRRLNTLLTRRTGGSQTSTTWRSRAKPTRQWVPSPGSMVAVRLLMRTMVPTTVCRYLSSKATFSPHRKSLRVGRGAAGGSGATA